LKVFTIGHSTHTIEHFLALLRQHQITAVADVRSSPFSRLNPQFNREALKDTLRQSGIAYVFLGQELGARTSDRTCYQDGRVQYARLVQRQQFREGLRRVAEGAERYRLVLVCAEKEPLACHRTLLVARQLENIGVEVVHIHADGQLETHKDAMSRLLKSVGHADQDDLFKSREQLIDEACAIQERRIAYVEEDIEGATPA
jgi:uncharacterized protein (DUF488 family)